MHQGDLLLLLRLLQLVCLDQPQDQDRHLRHLLSTDRLPHYLAQTQERRLVARHQPVLLCKKYAQEVTQHRAHYLFARWRDLTLTPIWMLPSGLGKACHPDFQSSRPVIRAQPCERGHHKQLHLAALTQYQ